MIKLSFQPKQITKKLLAVLNERSRDVITHRYGLDAKSSDKSTLEAIGKKYGITRERVRQIEEHSLASIRKSDVYADLSANFKELQSAIEEVGGMISEDELLEEFSKNTSVQNHLHFLLVVGDPFYKAKENEHFTHRWYLDQKMAEKVEDSIKNLYKSLSDQDIVTESEIVSSFLDHLKDVSDNYRDEEIAKRWLRMSKKIASNPLGEWGRADSSNINVKGIRDYAYLVIRRHGSPIHFKEVAEQISELFDKKAHVATCHNELIKDPRFVLVGRGLYALTDWGYSTGVVRDVIKDVLRKNGPLTKEEIIDKVLKERYVKENTIMVNLQNSDEFVKTEENKFTLV
jgi:DNA-directed RNA polymerase delta subunit